MKYSQNLGLGWQEVLVAVTTSLRELFLYCHDSAISEELTSQVHHERMWVDFMAQMLILSSCPAMFVCPAYSLLRGFRAKRFKVRGCLLCQENLLNRENSAFHLHSMATISHTIFESSRCFSLSKPSKRNRQPNSTFHGCPSFSPLPPPGISCRSPYIERNCYYWYTCQKLISRSEVVMLLAMYWYQSIRTLGMKEQVPSVRHGVGMSTALFNAFSTDWSEICQLDWLCHLTKLFDRNRMSHHELAWTHACVRKNLVLIDLENFEMPHLILVRVE